MESENGVTLKDAKMANVERSSKEEGSTEEINKEDISNSQEPFSGGNEVCEDQATDKDGPVSSGPQVLSSTTVSKREASNPGNSNKNSSKSNKLAKNLSNSKASVVFGRSTKPSLTQSLLFPSRGRHSDVMRRSIEVYPINSNVRQSQKLSSSQRNYPAAAKEPSSGVSSKRSSAKAASRSTNSASMPIACQSMPGKHVGADGTETNTDGPATLAESTSEPCNSALPIKEEDVHSNIPSLTPQTQQRRIHVSAFSFRLDKRAEKRREFFSRIEEKVQAKEVEKNKLQVKSKENQEAEIKQLRKSLAFKATPMPNFYKEPPPKVELKKIPTTRAVSPKLGRHKNSAPTGGNSLENGGSGLTPQAARDDCKSLKATQANGDKGSAALRKSIRSSLSKPFAQESTTARKVNRARTGGQDNQNHGQRSEKIQDQPHCSPKLQDQIEESYEKNGSKVDVSNPEGLPAEATVEG